MFQNKLWALMYTGYRYEIQTNDEACHAASRRGWMSLVPGNDDDALRRARQEARRGRRYAIQCVALHQHDKRHIYEPREW